MEDYQDEYNFLHHIKSVGPETSENAPTFSMVARVMGIPIYPRYELLQNSKRIFRTTPVSTWGGHVSHDTMTGFYADRVTMKISVRDLPICYWNKRPWLHPRDLMMFSYLHWPKVFWVWLPFIMLFCVESCLSPFEETSGKQLVYLRTKAFNLPLTYKICTWIINMKYHDSWAGVFAIYYKDENHPIRRKINESTL